jgi:glycosyltransferase involved in cell wall biosynthesis
MRLVIDLQGAQTRSRFRGIGRYTRSLTRALLEQRPDDIDVVLLFNGLFADTIEPLRDELRAGARPVKSVVWYAPGPLNTISMGNQWRFSVAALLRSEVVRALNADWFHESSIFEGFVDDAVTDIEDISEHTRVSISFYDAIPLLYPKSYLDPYPRFAEFYRSKAAQLSRADKLFAISEAARMDGLQSLQIDPDRVINISSGVSSSFEPGVLIDDEGQGDSPFVLYTGGADERKNLLRLLEAYTHLPETLQNQYRLVFAGRLEQSEVYALNKAAAKLGISSTRIHFTGFISDDELIALYRSCRVFVFPSWHEGFGLPALEAIRCGALTIASDRSSLPEVVGVSDALFDPFEIASIARVLERALTDEDFRARIVLEQRCHARQFSWERSALRALDAWRDDSNSSHDAKNTSGPAVHNRQQLSIFEKIAAVPRNHSPDEQALAQIAHDILRNREAVQKLTRAD